MAKLQQEGEVKLKRTKKAKKPKAPSDIRSVFRASLKTLDIEKLKKPWMAEKALRLVDTEEALQAWADALIADKSRYHQYGKEFCPVLAVDTEGNGLDTRILIDIQETPEGTLDLIYELNVEIAGVCLSADGIEGIYVPINHERGRNVSREAANRILQYLFDRCHLVFYNAKFDREILRLCLGINLRPYPHFEDVQALTFINDPKADLGDKKTKYTGSAGGLKALSKNVLGIEQIDLKEIGVVKASWCPIRLKSECGCTDEEKKAATAKGIKHSKINQHVPFTWIPTDVALWYAAPDAVCTWLLWQRMHELSRSRRLVHRIDHELVDSLVFIERQRFLIDTDRHGRTAKWHQGLLDSYASKLRDLALEAGYKEPKDEEGNINEDDRFNPDSQPQIANLLYKIKKYRVVSLTKKGGNPSVDKDAIDDLLKEHPEDQFLINYKQYKKYGALHPASLRYDPKDHSARIHLRQSTVAGGRLSAGGGDFDEDGGFGMNPQGVKKVEPGKMWRVFGNVLKPDTIPVEEIEEFTEADLHPSCFRDGKKAKGIIKNHIGQYTGYAICLVPKCTTCAEKHGILIRETSMDANETVNLRCLFIAPKGWTFFSVDYSNIEMRAAANLSGEEAFIKEFLEGAGDFHSLTASKVFPEFTDPNVSADIKKGFRDLAKIINFALLYGGTEYTIYENMKTVNPDITRDDCKKMVDKYWAGVPKFAEFVQAKQYRARTNFLCETATGRVINFRSAMEALHLHPPLDDEKHNLYEYYAIKRKAEEAKSAGDMEEYGKQRNRMDRLWKDPETGVRNAMEYNQFVGKIQRVSVNAPIQGICGDFMRIALSRLRKWAEADPLISSIFRLHTSVHDEVDFSVKNEYIPFILPRVTRLMKLRKYHIQKNWSVPIECDAEYGRSWDVDWNATDPGKATAWTHVEGMESYIPDMFDLQKVSEIIKLLGTDQKQAALDWMKDTLHPRAFECTKALEKAKTPKDIKRIVIAMLQLSEYWNIDNIPDDCDDKLESLESYEKRMGLGPKDRGVVPEFGYLGAVPLTAKVKRPEPYILGEDPQPELFAEPSAMEVPVPVSTVVVAEVEDEPVVVSPNGANDIDWGKKAETDFDLVVANRPTKIGCAPASPEQDANEHWDRMLTYPNGKQVTVEVKSSKRDEREFPNATEDNPVFLIEWTAVDGRDGWVRGKGEYAAFQHVDTATLALKGFYIVPLSVCRAAVVDVDWSVEPQQKPYRVLHRVYGWRPYKDGEHRLDKFCFVTLADLQAAGEGSVKHWSAPEVVVDQAAIAEIAHKMNEETVAEMKADQKAREEAETKKHEEAVAALPALLKEFEPPVFELADESYLNPERKLLLRKALGKGDNTIQIKMGGKVFTLAGKKLDHVPEEFLKRELCTA